MHYNNNAVPMVLRRLLTPQSGAAKQAEGRLLVNIADWPRPRVFVVYSVLMLGLIGTSTVLTLVGPRHWPFVRAASGASDDLPERADIERDIAVVRWQWGMWCTLMLLCSPLVWTHYLPLAYGPLALTCDGATVGAGKKLRAVGLGVWLLGAVLLAWPAARAAGALIGAVGVLWLVCVAGCTRALRGAR